MVHHMAGMKGSPRSRSLLSRPDGSATISARGRNKSANKISTKTMLTASASVAAMSKHVPMSDRTGGKAFSFGMTLAQLLSACKGLLATELIAASPDASTDRKRRVSC